MDENNRSMVTGSVLRGIKLGVAGLFLFFVHRFFRPFWYSYRINLWLIDEKDYVQSFTKSVSPWGSFEFEIDLSGDGVPNMIIKNRSFRSPIIIVGSYEFDPGLLASIMENPTKQQALKDEIQYGLSNAPGIYSFIDEHGQICHFEKAREFKMEYRLYPGGVNQHNLINGIIELASALKFIRQREQNLSDELLEGR